MLAPDCPVNIRFKVAKQLSTRLLAGVGTLTRMGAVLNFAQRTVFLIYSPQHRTPLVQACQSTS